MTELMIRRLLLRSGLNCDEGHPRGCDSGQASQMFEIEVAKTSRKPPPEHMSGRHVCALR